MDPKLCAEALERIQALELRNTSNTLRLRLELANMINATDRGELRAAATAALDAEFAITMDCAIFGPLCDRLGLSLEDTDPHHLEKAADPLTDRSYQKPLEKRGFHGRHDTPIIPHRR